MAEGFAVRRIQFKMQSAQPKPQAPLKGELPPQRLRGAARGYVFARAWANSYNPKRTFYGFASNFIRLWVPTAKPLSQPLRPASSPIGEPRRRKFQLFKNCCILFWGNVLYFPRSVRVGRPGLPLGADISPAFYRENAGVFRKEGDSGLDFLRSAACFLRSFCGAPAPTLSLLMFLLKGDFNIWQKN